MKIAIIGSRNFTDIFKLTQVLKEHSGVVTEIVSGGAKGADEFAEKWAIENNVPLKIFKPEWAKYGKGAGIFRNKQIIDYCEMCIAFWDGKSKGTLFSIELCKKEKKRCEVILFS